MTYSTVRAASSPELAYLRTAGQWSKLYLAIFKPATVYTARLSTIPTSNDRVVSVDFTGGAGTLTDILPDMTMYVGTTAGAYDLGVVRIRKSPIAGTFYIGEESDIPWDTVVTGGIYLTVVNEFDLWAKHINTVSDTVFYMDYDVAYTDQNSVFSPMPIMGSHRVLKLSGATVSTVFDFSNSYCLDSTISGYVVHCHTASAITGATTATPTITFDTAGWHMVELDITAANGKTSVGIRYVYVYNTANPPATVFQLGECFQDYDTAGWQFEVTMQDQIGLDIVPDRTLCILFSEDFYGDTRVSIGQLAGCENIICVGKISDENISINPEQSEVTLTIQGMQYWFNQVYAFPTGVILTKTTPTNWAEMQSPTVDKVLYRLLYWGCTAAKIMDIYLTSDTKIATELTSPASNLWEQIQELAFATLQARTGVDKFGRLFVNYEPQLVPVASRTWATVMTITTEDWYESINMQRVVVDSTGQIASSGIYANSAGSGGALFSLSPGKVFKHYGAPEVVDRLLLSVQSISNQLAGLLLGWRNNSYPNTEFKLSANNRMIDCFPNQKVQWTVQLSDTPRKFSFVAYFVPRRVEFVWDPETGWLGTSITIEMETNEFGSADGQIPGDTGGIDPPTIPDIPPIPDFPPIIPIDTVPTTGASVVLFHDKVGGMIYTTNFNADNVEDIVYTAFNAGLGIGALGANQKQAINWMGICPNGAVYVAWVPGAENGSFIARAPSLGGIFEVLYEQTTATAEDPNRIWAVGINPLLAESVAFVRGALHGTRKIYVGSYGGYAGGVSIPSSMGIMSTGLSFGFNNWLLTYYNSFMRISADGASVLASGASPSYNITVPHLRAGTTDITFHPRNFPNAFLKGAGNLTTLTLLNTDSVDITDGLDALRISCDPTGQFMMSVDSSVGGKGKSSDFGASWASLGSLPPGNYCFGYEGAGENPAAPRFVAAGPVIRETPDFGISWNSRENSSLTAITPFPDINLIKVVS